MNVSVLIGSYGDPSWEKLVERAYESAVVAAAPDGEVLSRHEPDGTLASVRNRLADVATGDWLCFLDADDELAPDYLRHMQLAWSPDHRAEGRGWMTEPSGRRIGWRDPDRACQHCGFGISAPTHTIDSTCPECRRLGRAKLLAPAVQYVSATGGRHRPRMPDKTHCGGDIRRGSWLVIGTLVPRSVFHAVGGFRDYPLYEDWALFAACWQAGCTIVEVPSAVYVAHMRPGSRNRGHDAAERRAVHARITADLGLLPDPVTPA